MSKHYKTNYNQKIISNIERIVQENHFEGEVADIIINAFSFMIKKKLLGGCHVLSTLIYVALNELKYNAKLLCGECQYLDKLPFDHSWVTLNEKIIDIAIYYPLSEYFGGLGAPIAFDIDTIDLKPTIMRYGINTGLPFSDETKFAIDSTITQYMDKYPHEENGLWTVLERDIFPYEDELNVEGLKEKYRIVRRTVVR